MRFFSKIALLLAAIVLTSTLYAEECLRVETSIGDRTFMINGVLFTAKTMCPNFTVGDEIVFIDGNPDGSSADALIVDQRSNETCSVWSQYPV